MRRIREDSLVYYRFESLSHFDGLIHGIFTRHGGVSPAPFNTLNVGGTVGDAPENVRINRERMAAAMGVDPSQTRSTWQVHGAEVVVARRDDPPAPLPPQADAMITAEADLPLMMRFADCVPVLLYDPIRRAIGIVHAGWRGTLLGVAAAAVQAMGEAFDSRPQDLIAAIGPSIGPCCYEVGPEVVAQVRGAFPEADDLIIPPSNSHAGAHLDLWQANRRTLQAAGVREIEVARLCTACLVHEFFSHRAEAGRTGRFGALISLRSGNGR